MDPSREICRGHQRALSPWSKRERERERKKCFIQMLRRASSSVEDDVQ